MYNETFSQSVATALEYNCYNEISTILVSIRPNALPMQVQCSRKHYPTGSNAIQVTIAQICNLAESRDAGSYAPVLPIKGAPYSQIKSNPSGLH